MGADLKTDQPESLKRRRLHDRHVFRRLQTWTCDDRPCTRSDVWFPILYGMTNHFQKIPIVQFFQKAEGISATHKNRIRFLDCTLRMGNVVDGHQVVSHIAKPLARLGRVLVSVVQRKRHEGDSPSVLEEVSDLRLHVVQVSAPVQSRVANQKKTRHSRISSVPSHACGPQILDELQSPRWRGSLSLILATPADVRATHLPFIPDRPSLGGLGGVICISCYVIYIT